MDEIIAIIAVLAMLAPFGILGIIYLLKWMMSFLQVRSGKVRAGFVTESYRLRRKFVKPKGGHIVTKSRTYNYSDKPGYIVFQGGTPECMYNEKTMQQINLADPKDKPEINPEHFSDLLIRMYNLGKLSGMKPSILLVILCIMAIAVSGITLALLVMQGGTTGAIAQNQEYLKGLIEQQKPMIESITSWIAKQGGNIPTIR